MTDDRLRALERRFRETGTVEDEAAWLMERVRVGESLDWGTYSKLAELSVEAATAYLKARVERGDLKQENQWLAVYCRDDGAALAASNSSAKGGLEEWVDGLPSFRGWPLWEPPASTVRNGPPVDTYTHGEELVERGLWEEAYSRSKEIQARAGVAMARLVLPESRFLYGPPDDGCLHVTEALGAIRALEAWIVTPNEETADHADSAGSDARFAAECAVYPANVSILGGWAATKCAGEVGIIPDPGPTMSFLLTATEFAVQALSEGDSGCCAVDQVSDAIRAELVPWALGYGDPVRDRVEARQRKASP